MLQAPIINLRSESDASYLIVEEPAIPKNIHPIGEIEVKSKEHPHISLGDYQASDPPKGFAIHINPTPKPGSIVAQITSLGTDQEYELVLHIANYGDRTISAEVWPV